MPFDMRDYEEYRLILGLWEQGESKLAISRATGIPRATVRDCINRYQSVSCLEQNRSLASRSSPDYLLQRLQNAEHVRLQAAYAYVLGMYLGDGYIVQNKRIYYLRIALDENYPTIIQRCVQGLHVLLPHNKTNVLKMQAGKWVEVICTYKFWPEVFPQHGPGYKHERSIKLEPWQQQIIDQHPLELFRGLYHSDGSRFSNVVNGKDYPRYSFTNRSNHICQLFCDTCDRLGIHWTVKHRKSLNDRATDIFISRRRDVAYLDQVVGPKC
ncbi:MAG: transcriptional regulator [Anaerolineaceae bacterium]|nr:transcriptional regulator [Anaerolineaceae bacterium]